MVDPWFQGGMKKVVTDVPASRGVLGRGEGEPLGCPTPGPEKAAWGAVGARRPRRAAGDPRDTYMAQALRETK